jgi:hypothetical protein
MDPSEGPTGSEDSFSAVVMEQEQEEENKLLAPSPSSSSSSSSGRVFMIAVDGSPDSEAVSTLACEGNLAVFFFFFLF